MSYTFSTEPPVVRRYLFQALIAIADFVEDVFWQPARTPRPEVPPHECLDWTDSELGERQSKAVPLAASTTSVAPRIWMLDSRTVLKPKAVESSFPGAERELLAWRYVWKHTSIPTPRYYCARDWGIGMTYLIMEYVEGETLEVAWPKLSYWTRLRVVWTVHSYVRQLRRAPVPPDAFPGPLGPRPRPCAGGLPDLLKDWPNDAYTCGPFTSAQEFHDNTKHYADMRAAQHPDHPHGPYPGMDTPVPLVFTHNDLSMGNILLGKDGLVYIIDWDYSGFYPVYAEYFGIEYDAFMHWQSKTPWQDWGWWAQFVAGPYFNYYRWIFGRAP